MVLHGLTEADLNNDLSTGNRLRERFADLPLLTPMLNSALVILCKITHTHTHTHTPF